MAVDVSAAAVGAPATPVPTVTATSWLDDDANFTATPSKAAQEVFDVRVQEAPATPATPAPTAPATLPAATEAKEAEAEPTEPGYTQDEHGKWHRPDGGFADAEEVEAIAAALAPESPEATAGTPAATEPAKPGIQTKQPIGEIIITAEGKPVDALPDLTVTYKANGKTLENVPLDKLIRKAQLGEYNEQKEQEMVETRTKAEQAFSHLAVLRQEVRNYEAFYQRLAQDDAFYAAFRQAEQARNTPEARLAVREQELQAIHNAQAAQAQHAQATQFVAQHIQPRIAGLEKQYPHIPPESLVGKFSMLTGHMLVNGQIPLQRLPEVARIIDSDLTQWAESQAQSQRATESDAVKTLQKRVTATQVALTLEKKRTARAMAPKGTAGALREPPKPTPPPKDAADSVSQLFAQIESGFGGQ